MGILVLVNQRFASGIGAAHWMAHTALLLPEAGPGFKLADHEAALAIAVELALGSGVPAEAGITGAGLEKLHLLVALGFVGLHGGAALAPGRIFGGSAAGAGFAGALAGYGEGRAGGLGVRAGSAGDTQAAQQRGGKQKSHIGEARVR